MDFPRLLEDYSYKVAARLKPKGKKPLHKQLAQLMTNKMTPKKLHGFYIYYGLLKVCSCYYGYDLMIWKPANV